MNTPAIREWESHELIWLEAAMSMVGSERIFAFRDIAALTRRSVSDLDARVSLIMGQRRAARALLDWARTQVKHVPGPAGDNSTKNFRHRPMPPSQLEPVSMARKMGARA